MTVDMISDAELGAGSARRESVLRVLRLLAWAIIVLGPILVGGSLGWWLTTGAEVSVDQDALRQSQAASLEAGAPLVSANEIAAMGLSLEDTRAILAR